jgi:hypothetical protein
MSCAENGFTIVVPRYGIEGKVYLSAPGSRSNWGWNHMDKSLVSPDGKRALATLDRVVVKMQIDYSKPYEPRIVFSSVDPPAGPAIGDAKIGHALPLEAPSALETAENEDDDSKTQKAQTKSPQGNAKNSKKRKMETLTQDGGRKVQKTKE